VQDVDAKIAALQQQLSTVPRQIAGPRREVQPAIVTPDQRQPAGQPEVSADGPESTEEPPRAESEIDWAKRIEHHRAAVAAYRRHRAELDRAEGDYRRLAEAARQAWESQSDRPEVDLRLAKGYAVTEAPGRSARWLLLAIAAGLAMATGLGMLSAGISTERPFTTVAQVEAALPVPVVGAISASRPEDAVSDPGAKRRKGGRLLALGGLALVVGCLGLLGWKLL
jgi:hypothetical protein